MAEIKRSFAGARMNKDVDERLIPNGEYRDAQNVKIRNTDSVGNDGVGDAGTVQNIKGNLELTQSQILSEAYSTSIPFGNGSEPKIVGSISNEKNNKAYFFVASPNILSFIFPVASINSKKILADSIIEVDTVDSASIPTTKLVVVDKYGVVDTRANVFANTNQVNTFQTFTAVDASEYRVGMKIVAFSSGSEFEIFKSTIQNIVDNEITLYDEVSFNNFSDISAVAIFFENNNRVLNFDLNVKINAINIIDDLLFFTDGVNEPKKINIKKCIEGTAQDGTTHTQLKLSDPKDKDLLLNYSGGVNDSALEISLSPAVNNDLKIDHVTVIKKAPRVAPTLEMKDTDRDGETTAFGLEYDFVGVADLASNTFENGYEFTITSSLIQGANAPNWLPNDILIFTEQSDQSASIVKASINNFDDTTGTLELTLISFSSEIIATNSDIAGSGVWDVDIQQKDPLFELKMVRFGCRYKYDDGECSSFGPWSEIAFLPGRFKYNHKKGFNLGMVNNLRSLKIKDFIPYQRSRDANIVAVEILYKPTDSPVCYIVKTIKRGIDPEWTNYTTSSPAIQPPSDWLFGELVITSEMIYKAVDANQLLRSWDNVPRKALAQEIAANRLMFSNYVQGYDINSVVGLLTSHNFDNTASIDAPKKSVKTKRNYKFGMVFGDKYGRETPVIANGFLQGSTVNNPTLLGGDLTVEKQFAAMRNYFELTQNWNSVETDGVPEEWMEYVKYYVKETSNEYYNLVMDRWYNAEDGNAWISFNSADRNKVDEETYLVLKKEHNSDRAVLEKARYKVIAISNEAPNDIKTEDRDMGGLTLTSTEFPSMFSDTVGLNPDNTAPNLLMTGQELVIDKEVWGDYLKQYAPKGDLKIGIVGEVAGTKLTSRIFRTVTYYSGGEDQDGVIRWNKPFGEAADMLDRFTNLGITVSGLQYSIVFKESVIALNKPEFDGKFFVKIEKDEALQNKVLKLAGKSADYDNIRSFTLSYIDSQGTNPGVEWTYEDENGNTTSSNRHNYTFLDGSGVPAVQNDTDTGFSEDNILGNNIYNANVAGWGSNVDNAPGTTAETQAKFMALGCDHKSEDGNNNPPGDLAFNPSDNSINWARKTFNFWQHIREAESTLKARMFIDGCRGKFLKYTGPNQAGENFGNNNDGTQDGQILRSPDYYKPTGLDAGIQSGDNFLPTQSGHLGRIVISAHTVDGPNNGNGDSLWGFAAGDEAFFRDEMIKDGTLFRFNSDPTQSVYQVVGDHDVLEVNNSANHSKLSDQYGSSNNNVSGSGGEGQPGLSLDDFLLDTGSGGYQAGGPLEDFNDYSGLFIGGVGNSTNSSGIQLLDSSNTCEKCGNDDGEFFWGRRESIRVEFRKLDTQNGLLAGDGNQGIDTTVFDPRSTVCHDGREAIIISLVESNVIGGEASPTTNAACFETEPKEDVGLDIYYEASNAIPMNLTKTNTPYFAPYRSKVTSKDANLNNLTLNTGVTDHYVSHIGYTEDRVIIAVKGTGSDGSEGLYGGAITVNATTQTIDFNIGTFMVFEHSNGTKTMAKITGFATPVDDTEIDYGETVFTVLDGPTASVPTPIPTGYYAIQTDVYKNKVELGWFNCYSFGNGVESDRIRDDFNAPQLDNGVKVSATFLEYGEEEKGSTIIYSGIYNSISGTNRLNEFNQAEKITKDLNPRFGSIQALKARDTDVIAFTEDKVLKITTQKDALFNADGNAQLLASNRVLGTAIPFGGDYGISKNPESLAVDEYRMYFTDKQRGAVMRLSQNGLTPISSVGMKTYFRDNLSDSKELLGTYDTVNSEYNLTIKRKDNSVNTDTTVSFNEGSKGWTSFKSFIPEEGASVSGKYFTAYDGKVYVHHSDVVDRNTFYGDYYESCLNMIFNDLPSSIKTFQAVNYEGSQARVTQFISSANQFYQPDGSAFNITGDGEYYNLDAKDGWYVNEILTDQSLKESLDQQPLIEFKDKEGKWYNRIDGGERSTITNEDLNEFSVQGLGTATAVSNLTEAAITAGSVSNVTLSVTGDFIDDSTNTTD